MTEVPTCTNRKGKGIISHENTSPSRALNKIGVRLGLWLGLELTLSPRSFETVREASMDPLVTVVDLC